LTWNDPTPANKRQMPCGVSKSTTFHLPETQNKIKLTNFITRPALGVSRYGQLNQTYANTIYNIDFDIIT